MSFAGRRVIGFAMLALWAGLLGCTRKSEPRAVADTPPPDLAAAQSGGAASLAAAPGFAFVPEEAVVLGTADPSELFGAASWRARAPSLATLAGEVQQGGFEPARTRFLFFAAADAAGAAQAAVVTSTPLQAPAGARTEVVLGTQVQRVDASGTGLASLANFTVLGPDGPLRRALQAGLGKDRPLAGAPALARYRDVLERLPAAALIRVAAVSSPLLTRLWNALAADASPVAVEVWRAAQAAAAAGAAVYLHGTSVRLVAVLQLGTSAASAQLATAVNTALGALRRDAHARTREERLWSTLFATATVRAHEGYAFVEADAPADLVVALLAR